MDGVVPPETDEYLNAQQAELLRNRFGEPQNRLSAYYRLANDIDASLTRGWFGGKGFAPIGDIVAAFKGKLDGTSFVVRDLFINRPEENDVGLFAVGNAGMRLHDIDVEGSIRGRNRVAGLVGHAISVVIENSSANGSFVGESNVGGLIGRKIEGTVKSSWSAGRVEGSGGRAGGLVGVKDGGAAHDNWSSADVSGANELGGLIGRLEFGLAMDNFAFGLVSEAANSGGAVGRRGYRAPLISANFWSERLSGSSRSTNGEKFSDLRDPMPPYRFSNFNLWEFGGKLDYPLLTMHSRARQSAAVVADTTRIFASIDNRNEIPLRVGQMVTMRKNSTETGNSDTPFDLEIHFGGRTENNNFLLDSSPPIACAQKDVSRGVALLAVPGNQTAVEVEITAQWFSQIIVLSDEHKGCFVRIEDHRNRDVSVRVKSMAIFGDSQAQASREFFFRFVE